MARGRTTSPVCSSDFVLRFGVLAATTAGVSMLGAVGPALAAADRGISIGDGEIAARGASVTVPVEFICPEGWQAGIGLRLNEKIAGRISTASGYASTRCTGERQQLGVYVPARHSARPFEPGSASVAVCVESGDYSPDHNEMCIAVLCSVRIFPQNDPEEPRWRNDQAHATIQLRAG